MSSLAERIQRRMDEQQQHANSSQGQMMAGSRDISFLSGGSELQSVHGEPVGEYPSLEDIYDDDDDGTTDDDTAGKADFTRTGLCHVVSVVLTVLDSYTVNPTK
ncbi:hypothetical protein BDV3_003478 [Batrachochytrium dendrobatidis]